MVIRAYGSIGGQTPRPLRGVWKSTSLPKEWRGTLAEALVLPMSTSFRCSRVGRLLWRWRLMKRVDNVLWWTEFRASKQLCGFESCGRISPEASLDSLLLALGSRPTTVELDFSLCGLLCNDALTVISIFYNLISLASWIYGNVGFDCITIKLCKKTRRESEDV